MDLFRRIALARGDEPADLVLRNAQLVNVFSGEIHAADVAIAGGIIVGVGPGYAAREEVDLAGRYLCPGFIDAHVHVESALVPPRELARALLPRGVTTIVTDPHEIANVLGQDGIRFMLENARGSRLSMLVNAPSCVPATAMETSGADLSAGDLAALRDEPAVLGLAEVMNFPGVLQADPAVLAKLGAFSDRVIDGHAPLVTGQALVLASLAVPGARCQVPGPTGCIQDGEPLGHNRAWHLAPGTWHLARRAAARYRRSPAGRPPGRGLDRPPDPRRHCGRCRVRDRDPDGHAQSSGGTARRVVLRLGDRGAIAPGRRADLVVFSRLENVQAERVYVAGELVAHEGELRIDLESAVVPEGVRGTMRLPSLCACDFAIPAAGRRARVIGLRPNQLLTDARVMDVTEREGRAVADPARDLLKMAVVERHGRSGEIGLGFVHGLGLARGALASSVAHDHHNLVIAGADDTSMLTAARAVAAAGGGQAAALGEKVLALLPLPIAGLMSDQPIERVRDELAALVAAAQELGSPLRDPFMAMSFLALEVIPALKLTDRGLVDVDQFALVPLFV